MLKDSHVVPEKIELGAHAHSQVDLVTADLFAIYPGIAPCGFVEAC
jgi:hypothetical protein